MSMEKNANRAVAAVILDLTVPGFVGGHIPTLARSSTSLCELGELLSGQEDQQPARGRQGCAGGSGAYRGQ